MRATCPMCGSEVAEGSVDSTARAATCEACHALFYVRVQHEAGGRAAGVDARLERDAVELPYGFCIERADPIETVGDPYRSPARRQEEFTISWPWSRSLRWLMPVFVAGWWIFLVYVYLSTDTASSIAGIAMFALLGAAGVFVLYLALAAALNRTTIAVRGEALTIEDGPIPWLGSRRIPLRELGQLYCEARLVGGKKGRPVVMYSLYAQLQSDDRIMLTDRLREPEQALYLEQQLELRLGIADVEVAGELDRNLYDESAAR